MMVKAHIILLLLACTVSVHISGAAPGDETWQFTEVRPGCHMFWWLMYCTAPGQPQTKPLIIWLSGGLGASGTGWGNFEELGPLDWTYQPRNYTWLDYAHLLFVDSPVGTGFSTVDSPDLLATTHHEVAADLIATLKNVLEIAPDLVGAPIYILGESSAGRCGPIFANELHKAIVAGEIDANLEGVIIRDGWSHPVVQMPALASYGLETGLIDSADYRQIDATAQLAVEAITNEEYVLADQLYWELMTIFTIRTFGANLYYITATEPPLFVNNSAGANTRFSYRQYYQDPLDFLEFQEFVNTVVKPKLEMRTPNLREWLFFNYDVQDAISVTGDSMRSTVPIIEELLEDTDVKVVVVNGQLDQIVTTAGTLKWVEGLTWSGQDGWVAAPRLPLVVDDVVEGYVKKTDRLSFWWINRAGHETFYHNPIAGYHMLQELIAGISTK